MFILRVCAAFAKAKISYAVVGGYAVALHGAVRGTVDVDFIVRWNLETLVNVEKVLGELGLESRLPITAAHVFQFREEYIQQRNLIAWNFYTPSNPMNQVDIIITHDLTHNKVKMIAIEQQQIAILAIHDLIAMKKTSGRPQDLEDVKSLEKLAGR